MTDERLKAWFDGELEDDELTAAEVKWLEKAVFSAVARKMTEREGVFTFGQHGTVQ